MRGVGEGGVGNILSSGNTTFTDTPNLYELGLSSPEPSMGDLQLATAPWSIPPTRMNSRGASTEKLKEPSEMSPLKDQVSSLCPPLSPRLST